MTTAQIVVALTTTILMLVLGIKTKSKIIFTILLIVSLSLWQLLDNVVKLCQLALDNFGTKTGWWEPFSIQNGWGAALLIGATVVLALKTRSRVVLCTLAVVACYVLGVDAGLVEMVNSIGETIQQWASKISISV